MCDDLIIDTLHALLHGSRTTVPGTFLNKEEASQRQAANRTRVASRLAVSLDVFFAHLPVIACQRNRGQTYST